MTYTFKNHISPESLPMKNKRIKELEKQRDKLLSGIEQAYDLLSNACSPRTATTVLYNTMEDYKENLK